MIVKLNLAMFHKNQKANMSFCVVVVDLDRFPGFHRKNPFYRNPN